MKISDLKAFTMIEIVIVIFITGIIGSMAAGLLYQGADIYVKETNRQGFISQSRSAFWRLMRETQGQRSSEDFDQSGQAILNLKNANNIPRVFRIASNEFEFSILANKYIDVENEIKRLNKKREELSKSLEISNQRLNNDKFVENAKQELIDQEKQNVQNLNNQIESINSTLKSLDN